MTTERNIIIHAGQTFTLSLDYAGTAGRGQRMHIRASDAAADVIAILTHNGDANARVIFDGTDSLDITIGASVNGGWLVGANRVEWVYDIEDYDLSDTDDVVIAYRGKVVVYGNRTRPEDVTPSAALPSGDGRYVRFDGVQSLTDEQKLQARENIGAGTGGGGGSGDVVGPASATDDRIAAFDGTTGKLIKQGAVTATAVAAHLSNTSNPHSVTAAQVGADPAGTAASAVSTHNSVTTGAHGMTAFGASLVDDVDASAARTTLGLGTAATAATGDFAAASHTHAASDVTSGTFDAARLPAASETALGAVELATTAEALTGTDTARAVTPAGVKAVADTKAATSHTHAASDITSGTLDAARLPAPTTTALGGVKRNTGSAGQFVTGIDSDGSLLRDTPAAGSPGGSSGQLQYNNAGTADGSPLWREDANTVTQRNGPSAQTFRVYGTYTDASNYERLALNAAASGDWFQIAAETAGTGVDDIGLALTPAGTGALSAQVPDSGTAGGNARGLYATDWQRYRTAATAVASGARSTVCGGENNTASGYRSVVCGGRNGVASGINSFVGGGSGCSATGTYAVCAGGGGGNAATGSSSTLSGGYGNAATGNSSTVSGGNGNTASGIGSWIGGGLNATTRGLTAAMAHGMAQRSAAGDRQKMELPLSRAATTDTTPTVLTSDAGTPGTANQMVLPNNSTHFFEVIVVAHDATNTKSATWKIEGTIRRGANAASTTIVGTNTTTALSSDFAGAPTTAPTATADTTNGALAVTFTGLAATTIYPVAFVRVVQAA